MAPILFTFDRQVIYTYSVVFGLFLVAGLSILAWQQREHSDGRLDAALWALAAGLVGARLAYLAVNRSYYAERPEEILSLTQGGYSLHGGLVAGFLGLALYAWATPDGSRRVRLRRLSGALLPVLALGLVGGWLGCLLGGCAYGRAIPPPQRWYTPDWPDLYGVHAFRLPSQLFGLALGLLLLAVSGRLRSHVGLFLVIYGLGSFVIGFTRGDLDMALGPLWTTQWADLALVGIGLIIEAATLRLDRRQHLSG